MRIEETSRGLIDHNRLDYMNIEISRTVFCQSEINMIENIFLPLNKEGDNSRIGGLNNSTTYLLGIS